VAVAVEVAVDLVVPDGAVVVVAVLEMATVRVVATCGMAFGTSPGAEVVVGARAAVVAPTVAPGVAPALAMALVMERAQLQARAAATPPVLMVRVPAAVRVVVLTVASVMEPVAVLAWVRVRVV
jgi:hypothetical protein